MLLGGGVVLRVGAGLFAYGTAGYRFGPGRGPRQGGGGLAFEGGLVGGLEKGGGPEVGLR